MPRILLFALAISTIYAEDVGVRVILGLGDTSPTKWDGSATASGAAIRAIEPWRFEDPDAIDGTSWKVSTRAIRLFGGANRQGTPPNVANGVIVQLSGATESSELHVKTAQGDFNVRMADIPYGKMAAALNGRVMLDRIPAATRLTHSPDEQDFPAAAARNGEMWIAYMEFKHNQDHDKLRANFQAAPANFDDRTAATGGDAIFARHYANGKWDDPVALTPGGEDLYRPAAAIDAKGRAWIFWSKNEKGNFDLFARSIEGGKPGATVRLTTAPGSDIDPAATTDSQGNVWVAWQGWRNGHGQIFAAKQNGNAFSAPALVASSQSNEWNPAIAADSNGRVTVAWDSYRNGNYDVFYRTATGAAAWGKEMTAAASAKFESRPSIAYAPDGRLWIAYEEGTERWGKDWGADETSGYALYSGRSIRLSGFEADGRAVETAMPIDSVLPGVAAQRLDVKNRQSDLKDWTAIRPNSWKERKASATPVPPVSPKNSSPRLHIDASGRIWLAARSPHPITWNPLGTVWSEYIASYDGATWTGPVFIGNSDNVLDNRPALVSLKAGELTVIGSSDSRRNFQLAGIARPRQTGAIEDPYNNDLYMNRMTLPAAGAVKVSDAGAAVVAGLNTEDKAEQASIAKMRAARIAGKYRVVRGEFHRHSEVSMDGGSDGTLLDQWRYALDAGKMDWIGCCDHDNGGGREYTWWLTQKLTDVFYTPGAFVPMFSYERSVGYPEGHRNVIFAQRGVRTLPRLLPISDPETPRKAPDTQMLYAYLRKFNGITASHTSGTNMGTDWRDNDPQTEPVVEIYQGDRQNYEMPGAPRSNNENDSIGGWRPKGFVSLALEMGYKLAFQASSDHVSTHMSYCNILSTGLDRQSLLDGFKSRHVYGATDNILAEFKSGTNIMGDSFSSTVAPNFNVKLNGTAPFAKVHIIKDNKYVYTTSPGKADVEFQWRDTSPTAGKTSYYYVRGEQADGELVWVSPMWITYTGK